MTTHSTSIPAQTAAKYAELKKVLGALPSIAVAFSGGIDSALLLFAAREALGSHVLALTARSVFFPAAEAEDTVLFCREYGIRHQFVDIDILKNETVRNNPPDRCYFCKKEIFTRLLATAAENGIPILAEGANTDDLSEYRPGLRAIRELSIHSPLAAVGLHKNEIRLLAKEKGLSLWNKPSSACLATRLSHGRPILPEDLRRTEKAEAFLRSFAFRQLRVRILPGNFACIELLPEDFSKLLEPGIRKQVCTFFRQLKFARITLDLVGYRSGSMEK